jgi:hypothetical protein
MAPGLSDPTCGMALAVDLLKICANQLFTGLVEFEVDPERQQQLIDGLTDQVQQRLAPNTGFISASFHPMRYLTTSSRGGIRF